MINTWTCFRSHLLTFGTKLDGVIGLLEFHDNFLGGMNFTGQPGKEGLELSSMDVVKMNLETSLKNLFNDFVVTYEGHLETSRHNTRRRLCYDLGLSSSCQRNQRLRSFFQNMGSGGYN